MKLKITLPVQKHTHNTLSNRVRLAAGFTLIELLVVITIIGILATLAPTAITNVMLAATRARALNSARNIGMALKTYANDNEGAFPPADSSAADAFSKSLLAKGYITDKKQFFVKGSKYTPVKDRDTQNSGDQKKLSEDENHWAYMAKLDDSGNGRWPLLFDGPNSAEGKYSDKKTEKGGVWEGKVAIVVRLDGSASAETLTSDFVVKTDGQENILKPSENWASGGKIAMP